MIFFFEKSIVVGTYRMSVSSLEYVQSIYGSGLRCLGGATKNLFFFLTFDF